MRQNPWGQRKSRAERMLAFGRGVSVRVNEVWTKGTVQGIRPATPVGQAAGYATHEAIVSANVTEALELCVAKPYGHGQLFKG